ncbi:mitochondrial carrier domain-containing protein [Gamsiella multidivaricata]|uniref:mitochondrial carrier domain-containing protein n=1 Tax=Gamsiella multidivaricata TaxID=101098 RepID=UPI00221EB688|nr:mitochondrial carrier domain-containing protein [Gamsiella multidivaricata]KAI7817616.1 mitochondrial carrier domain-containing protein [Gamsiella multidivaricata]
MVLSAIWTLAFGTHNPLPETQDESHITSNDHDQNHGEDHDDNEVNIAKILARQRDVTEAERDILGTTVYLPAPSIRDETAENKSGFILVVTSLTLNNIGCYPFFGIRDRHQVFPKLFPETSPRSSFQYLRQVYRSQGVLGIWYGMPCSMICHTCTIFYEAFLNSIIGRLRQRSRKVLPKAMIYLSTRIVEFLLYIPLYPLLRNSLLLRMDSRTGPWPANSSYFYLLKTFAIDYVHDLIGLFYSRGRSPSILPLYSTVLPSYILNLLFEIIQTWIFRWIYPKLVPASFFTRKKSSKSGVSPPSPPPLLSAMPLSTTSGPDSRNITDAFGSSSSSASPSRRPASTAAAHRGGQQQQPPSPSENGTMTAVTATEISATIMAAMPTYTSSNAPSSTNTVAVNRARRGLRYLSTVTPRNPTLLQEFYPEMVCAMTSSMITRVLLYPLDTVACRVSAQGGTFPGIGVLPTPYSGFWDCWIRSIRRDGILGLYSGVVDCIVIEAMVRWVVLEGTWFAHLVIKWIHRG